MVFTYEYDTTYTPPFPIVDVELSLVGVPQSIVSTRAWIDSGADATLVPRSLLQQLKARRHGKKRMRGVSGIIYQVNSYIIAVKIGAYTIHAVEVLENKQQSEMLLGRDVLNHLIVTLNGLASITEVTQ